MSTSVKVTGNRRRALLLELALLSLPLLPAPLLLGGCGGAGGASEVRAQEDFVVMVLRRNQQECARLSKKLRSDWWDLSFGHPVDGAEGVPPELLDAMRADRARAAAVIERLEREIDALRATARPGWILAMDELMVNHRVTCRVFIEPRDTLGAMTDAGNTGRGGYDDAWRRYRKDLLPSDDSVELLGPRRDRLFDEVYAAVDERLAALDAERARSRRLERERQEEEYRAHLKEKEEREARRARERREALERIERRRDPDGRR